MVKRGILLLTGLLGLGFSATARADIEYSIILLDRTGSMSTAPNPSAPAVTRWTNAIDDAVSLVTADLGDFTTYQRRYAIWDFRLGAGTAGPVDQDNALLVWPKTSADCVALGLPATAFISLATVPGVQNNYCDFGTGDDTPYGALRTLLTSYKTDTNRTPDPGGNGRTPLADSLCRVLDQMQRTDPNAWQTVTFESDGLENQSNAAGPCGNFSIASTATPYITDENYAFNKTILDWGLSAGTGSGQPDAIDAAPGGSWQARIVRRALKLNQPDPAIATNTALQINQAAVTKLSWRVSVHYERFNSSSSTPLALMSVLSAPTSGGVNADEAPTFSSLAFKSFAATAAAPAATPSVSLTIPPAELALYRNLGSSRFPTRGGVSRAKLREITYTNGDVYGTGHARQGDVDDSNCVDRADYNIIMQKDVWFQRAVRPLEVAMRADLNRDGWVNVSDRNIVIANWGSGCVNPPGPRPIPVGTCGNGVKDATETDIDCGGSDCSDCANNKVCSINSDCFSNLCDAGICKPQPNLTTSIAVTQDWGAGYCATLSVSNYTTKATKSWTAKVDTNMSSIYQIWGGTRSASSGVVTLTPVTGQRVINVGTTNTAIGFCANRTDPSSGLLPVAVSATGVF